jgi:predicted RNase H-like HicB family nuclease
VEEVKTYRVVAERSGKWWAAHAPELAGVHTQARRLEQVEAEAREAIALMLDVEPESVAVRVEPKLPDEVSALIAAVAAAHSVTENAQAKEREAAHEAARALVVDLGLPQRDAGKILGVTHQRVQQILSGNRKRRSVAPRAHAHS